ncbi:MAG: metal-binding protein [Thiotrichales bacterium SG8_50]|nr:MAG: metal-binding protein [Thiotrichales bacterium SG8_50]
MVQLLDLVAYANDLLEIERFDDYCPNGLQVEGRGDVNKIVSGVTASLALVEAAVAAGANVLLVHHGYFWRGEDPRLIGLKYRRLRGLFEAEISLVAYHLPLDAHPVLGNNAQLAERLGLNIEGRFGPGGPDRGIAMYGNLPSPMAADGLAEHLARALGRTPLHVPGGDRPVFTLGWCTGAAQGYIEDAAALGVDAFITGEISEQTVHVARESGVHFYAAGHHATERYGAQALASHLAERFGLEHEFIDIDNPA